VLELLELLVKLRAVLLELLLECDDDDDDDNDDLLDVE
jgi:hypothetical protein